MKKRVLGLIAFVVALAMVITILPVNTGAVQAASKKPKLSKKSISVDIDAKETLTIKNVKDDSVIKWKIANPDVAKVTSKGVIKGKKAGETTVSCTVKNAKKKYTLSAKVTVTDSISVSSQKKLESALNRDDTALIILKTSSKKSFTIPEGDYSGKTLVVDAKKSDVVNNGVFKAITIKAIAANTWTENAQGNVLTISAAAGHIVIPADANFSEIIVTSTNASSNFVLDIAGNIGKVTVESQTKLKLNVTGTVDAIAVNDRAQLDIKGSSEQNIPIEVSDTADGTLINSNIPVVVETQSDTEINLGEGAENSTITASNAEKAVEVTNNTSSSISVTTGDVSQDVNSGKNATIDGAGKITNTTTPEKEEKPENDTASSGGESASGASGSVGGGASGGGSSGGGYSGGGSSGGGASSGGYSGGGSSGGGASSSGNLTRQIYYFEAITPIEAGVVGETLKSIEQLGLPSTVKGYSRNGETVEIAVTSWENTDNYAPENNSIAKTYYFTARLGRAVTGVPYTVEDGVAAKASVYVTSGVRIQYANDYSTNIEVVEYKGKEWQTDRYVDGVLVPDTKPVLNNVYYKITNNTGETSCVVPSIHYYDDQGRKIPAYEEGESLGEFNDKESKIIWVQEGGKTYSSRKIEIFARALTHDVENALSKIKTTVTKGENSLVVKLKNESEYIIGRVSIRALLFDENGEVICLRDAETTKIYAPGNEDTIELKYPIKRIDYESSTGTTTNTYFTPESYGMVICGAKIESEGIEEITTGVSYVNDYSKGIEVVEYKGKEWQTDRYVDGVLVPDTKPVLNNVYYKITNNTGETSCVVPSIHYYDDQGRKIPAYEEGESLGEFNDKESKIIWVQEGGKTYSSRKIEIFARALTHDVENALSKIKTTVTKGENSLVVKLKNESEYIIGRVSIRALLFDENGEVICLRDAETTKIYAPGNEDTIELKYPIKRIDYESSTGTTTNTYYVPDSYLIYIFGADIQY